jgi:mannose-6-phosphate isomerase-like protein (cupin superfamily)
MNAINLAEKLSAFTEHWQPRTVGEFNGHDVMVVKVKGTFVWHKHDDTDDFFLVLEGADHHPDARRKRHAGPG